MPMKIMVRSAANKALIVMVILLASMLSHPCLISAGEGTILFHSFDEEGSPWICSISPDSTEFKKIIKNGLWPVWSPDKKMFAYFALQDRKEGSASIHWTVSVADGTGNILHDIKPIKTRIIELHLPSYCEWSPDGKKLAITTAARSHVYVRIFNVDTRQVQEVLADPVDDLDTAFLGSSVEWLYNTRLLFINGSPAKSDEGIHIIDLEKNRVRTWNKRGTFLNYSINKGILGVVHTDKETVFNLLDEEGTVKATVGKLDGKYFPVSNMHGHNVVLLLIIEHRTHDNVPGKFYLVNVSTMEMHEIGVSSDRRRLFDPAFSPDGNKIIYAQHTMDDTDGEYSKAYYIYDCTTKKSTLLKTLKKATGDDMMSFFAMFAGKQREFSWK